MNYKFPENLSIEEVRDVINAHNAALGTKAFIEADRGDHVIFNYVVAFDGSFPEANTGDAAVDRARAILRECRGLIMDKSTGGVMARRFQKFFNINEKPETQIGAVDWSQPHCIMEKLDGSMITPLRTGGEIRWGTKMGVTEVATPVETFANARRGYLDLARDTMDEGQTAIFEWCSRKQKIVVDYPEDRLVLTAIRDNATGTYRSHGDLLAFGDRYGIEVVNVLPGGVVNIQTFMSEAQDLEGSEGYVLRFGHHLMKVKGSWYVQIHKTKDMIQSEKAVWDLILSDRVDDAKAFMDDADRNRVSRFHDAFERGLVAKAEEITAHVAEAKRILGDDKKRFALEYAQTFDALIRPLLFSVWDGKPASDAIRAHLPKFIGSSTRIEAVRPLVSNVRWDDFRDTSYVSDV